MTQKEKLIRIMNDPILWIETFCKITNKDRKSVKFVLNRQQRELLKVMNDHRYTIVCKNRQIGITSIVAARALYKCLTQPHTNCLLMSYRDSSLQDIYNKLKNIYFSIPKSVTVPLFANNKNELRFANGSSVVVATCGTKDIAHGSTLSYVHISEASLCRESLSNQIASISAALVPDGEICIESTPQGGLSYFSELYMDSERGENLFYPVFFSWINDHPNGMHEKEQKDYAEKYIATHGQLPTIEQLSPEELDLYNRGCTLEMICWRKYKIKELGGEDKFRENFPVDAQTCFLTSMHDSMFDAQLIQKRLTELHNIKPIPMPKDLPSELKSWYGHGLDIWAVPEKGVKYFAGVDCSEGIGKNSDYSVIEIMDENGFQCAELRTNKTKPFAFAKVVNELGLYYNRALLCIERATAGLAVIPKLSENYGYSNLYRSKDPDAKRRGRRKDGFITSQKTKTIMINDLVEWHEKGDLTINSKQLLTEMLAFSFIKGKMEAATGKDDCVLASALMIQGHKNGLWYL